MSHFVDKVMACRDCGKEFVFSSGEQEFYSTRGFSDPTRCPDCRQARKTRNGGATAAGTFGSGSSRSTGARQMFRVICADCGTETEVPFEPRAGRPVYCRSCFDKRSVRR